MQLFSLKTIAEKLHHNHIDLLKMDIEGSEFEAVESLRELDIDIGQICLETPERFFADGDKKLKSLFKTMRGLGYIK